MGRRVIDITGQRFGRIEVVRTDHYKAPNGELLWLCLCDCGTLFEITGSRLRSGNTTSCGCLKIAGIRERSTTHGHAIGGALSMTYMSWKAMKARCANAGNPYYGGKGVTVCPEWHNSFENFLRDMGERPSKAHTLARRGDAGNYRPGNVEWKLQVDNLAEMHERRAS